VLTSRYQVPKRRVRARMSTVETTDATVTRFLHDIVGTVDAEQAYAKAVDKAEFVKNLRRNGIQIASREGQE